MAAVVAQKCLPVSSSWVLQFILTCDNQLAVQFLNGRCFLYPNTTKYHWDLAVAWGDPGNFVRVILYKKFAYKEIKNPCPAQACGGGGGGGGTIQTGCCANLLPTSLTATVTNGGADNGPYTLTYDTITTHWRGSIGPCGLEFYCFGATFEATINIGTLLPASSSCSPLAVVFANADLRTCAGTGAATITVTT